MNVQMHVISDCLERAFDVLQGDGQPDWRYIGKQLRHLKQALHKCIMLNAAGFEAFADDTCGMREVIVVDCDSANPFENIQFDIDPEGGAS